MEKKITICRQNDPKNSSYVPGTMAERIALVWPLTCEAVSLGKKYDAEQRLQRHITRFVSQKGCQTKDLADVEYLTADKENVDKENFTRLK
ncbi:MAG: hypothetical protein FWG77_05835 [Treponema sp.]|nr:hypothetical protein [Treponema sp.]